MAPPFSPSARPHIVPVDVNPELLCPSVHCEPGQYIARSTAIGTSDVTATETSVLRTPRFHGLSVAFGSLLFTWIVLRLDAGTVTVCCAVAPPGIRYRKLTVAARWF